jgi:hypothetical protein
LLLSGCQTLRDLSELGAPGVAPASLHSLSLRCCRQLTALTLPAHAHQLRGLDLVGMGHLSASQLERLLSPEACASLRTLLLAEAALEPALARTLRTRCPLLERLDLRWCEHIGDGDGGGGGGDGDGAATLSPLEQLLEGGGSATAAAAEALRVLQCRCLPLRDSALRRLDGSALLRLDLGRCDELSDQALGGLARQAPRLTHLNLEWCLRLSDWGAARVLNGCDALEEIKLEGCKLLSDQLLVNLVTRQPHRPHDEATAGRDDELECPRCSSSSSSMWHRRALADGGTGESALRLINFAWINSVTDQAIERLTHAFDGCVAVNYYGDRVRAGHVMSGKGEMGWDAEEIELDAIDSLRE